MTSQASFVMASVSSGQVGELASSTSSSVFIGAPPAQRKDSSKAKASPTPEALANMAKAMEHWQNHTKVSAPLLTIVCSLSQPPSAIAATHTPLTSSVISLQVPWSVISV